MNRERLQAAYINLAHITHRLRDPDFDALADRIIELGHPDVMSEENRAQLVTLWEEWRELERVKGDCRGFMD